MSDPVKDLMAQGDFDGAAAAVEQALAAGFDPGLGIQLFGIHVYRDDPDRAEAVLRQVGEVARIPIDGLLECLTATREYLARRRDPAVAGRRRFVLSGGNQMPPPWLAALVQASVEHAGGNAAAAARTLAEVKPRLPALAGTLQMVGGTRRRFAALRDSDDLTSAVVPCFAGPVVVDIPMTEIARLDFTDRRASWDRLWAPALVTLRDGRRQPGRIPTRYPGSGAHRDPTVRLSSMTLWDHDPGYAVAWGQVDLWADRATVGLEGVASILFDQ